MIFWFVNGRTKVSVRSIEISLNRYSLKLGSSQVDTIFVEYIQIYANDRLLFLWKIGFSFVIATDYDETARRARTAIKINIRFVNIIIHGVL